MCPLCDKEIVGARFKTSAGWLCNKCYLRLSEKEDKRKAHEKEEEV